MKKKKVLKLLCLKKLILNILNKFLSLFPLKFIPIQAILYKKERGPNPTSLKMGTTDIDGLCIKHLS